MRRYFREIRRDKIKKSILLSFILCANPSHSSQGKSPDLITHTIRIRAQLAPQELVVVTPIPLRKITGKGKLEKQSVKVQDEQLELFSLTPLRVNSNRAVLAYSMFPSSHYKIPVMHAISYRTIPGAGLRKSEETHQTKRDFIRKSHIVTEGCVFDYGGRKVRLLQFDHVFNSRLTVANVMLGIPDYCPWENVIKYNPYKGFQILLELKNGTSCICSSIDQRSANRLERSMHTMWGMYMELMQMAYVEDFIEDEEGLILSWESATQNAHIKLSAEMVDLMLGIYRERQEFMSRKLAAIAQLYYEWTEDDLVNEIILQTKPKESIDLNYKDPSMLILYGKISDFHPLEGILYRENLLQLRVGLTDMFSKCED
jgi:hypothetical protein